MTWYEEPIIKGYTGKRIKLEKQFPVHILILPCALCRKPTTILVLKLDEVRRHHCSFCHQDFDTIVYDEGNKK